MKYDLETPINGLDDKQVIEIRKELDPETGEEGVTKTPLTLRKVCVISLMSDTRQLRMTGADRALRGELAVRIHQAENEIVFVTEELALLKELIGYMYLPLTVHRAFQILDQKEDNNAKGSNIIEELPSS